MITVSISGKAWHSQSFTCDDGYDFTNLTDLKSLKESAVIRKRGRGMSVVLTGKVASLSHLAEWLEIDGDSWLNHSGDDDYAKAEGRACLEAAKRIRQVLA